ncbi:hypothetical protein MAFF301069_31140 [Ralstonia pseudosolanacearum]|nr:hypothetical protein MAFF301069_31140 [Ralstonia pseudosolanacearum]
MEVLAGCVAGVIRVFSKIGSSIGGGGASLNHARRRAGRPSGENMARKPRARLKSDGGRAGPSVPVTGKEKGPWV